MVRLHTTAVLSQYTSALLVAYLPCANDPLNDLVTSPANRLVSLSAHLFPPLGASGPPPMLYGIQKPLLCLGILEAGVVRMHLIRGADPVGAVLILRDLRWHSAHPPSVAWLGACSNHSRGKDRTHRCPRRTIHAFHNPDTRSRCLRAPTLPQSPSVALLTTRGSPSAHDFALHNGILEDLLPLQPSLFPAQVAALGVSSVVSHCQTFPSMKVWNHRCVLIHCQIQKELPPSPLQKRLYSFWHVATSKNPRSLNSLELRTSST